MLKKIKIFSLLIAIIFLLYTNFAPNPEVDVLFCTYDMGESNAFKPLMAELARQKISYKVLALGKSLDVFRKDSTCIQIDLPDVKWDRSKILEPTQLTLIKQKVKPKFVLGGMVSAIQAQILNLFKKEGMYVTALYDAFEMPDDKNEGTGHFLQTIHRIDEYFIPVDAMLPEFKKFEATQSSKLSVVGQPTLEYWEDIFSKTNTKELRKKLGIKPEEPIILFAGDYGDTYESYFRIFVKAATMLPHVVLVTHHPKTNGTLEEKIIKEENATNIRILDSHGPTTAETATIARVLVCHKSTVGMQALYVGLPVVYVVKKGELNNFGITQKLAPVVSTPQEVYEALKPILATTENPQLSMKDLGIPHHSAKNIAKRISEELKKQ